MSIIVFFIVIIFCNVNISKTEYLDHYDYSGIKKEDEYLLLVEQAINIFSYNCRVSNNLRYWKFQKAMNTNRLTMKIYKAGIFYNFTMTTASNDILNSQMININAKTLIYVHGYQAPPQPQAAFTMGKYLQGYNILSYDTTNYTHIIDYIYVSGFVPLLGDILGDFISDLYSKGLSNSNIHIVGLSIGAQISSFAARRFANNNNVLISRITGLDPAALCFAKKQTALRPSDAEYVDIIRTSVLSYSHNIAGHSEYYVNGRNGVQSGCNKLDYFCSHSRSIKLFADTVRNPSGFIAKRCVNINTYDCQINETSLMGFGSDRSTRGDYTLNTNNAVPYAKGVSGIL